MHLHTHFPVRSWSNRPSSPDLSFYKALSASPANYCSPTNRPGHPLTICLASASPSSFNNDTSIASSFLPLVRKGDIQPHVQPLPYSSSRQSQSGAQVVLAFFESVNARDYSSLLHLLADNVTHSDLSHNVNQEGKLSVANFYQDLMLKADGVRFQVEDITEGSDTKVGVTWQMFLDNQAIPLGRGLGFYTLNQQREISSVRQSPEHFIKSADQFKTALSLGSPMFRTLAPFFLQPAPAQQSILPPLWSPQAANRDPPALRSAGQWGIEAGVSSPSNVGMVPSLSKEEEEEEEWSSAVVESKGSSGQTVATRKDRDEPSLDTFQVDLTFQVHTFQVDLTFLTFHTYLTFQVDLNGTWKKAPGQDTAAFEKALDLWQLSFLQKTAARLIEGVEIIQTRNTFSIGMFVAQIPQFKIQESYSIGGVESKVMRRDMRAGDSTATAIPLPNGVEFTSTFSPPLPGKLVERYILLSPGLMEVTSSVSIGGKVAKAVLIYKLQP